MAFQQQGGSAANNDYDYETGSGMDSFMSRSLDEVSWQSSGLGTTYTTLSSLPIGTSPTSSTPTNYDQTQITGSQSGTTSLGGSGTGNAGNSGGLQLSGGNQTITLSDGQTNRLLLGVEQGGF